MSIPSTTSLAILSSKSSRCSLVILLPPTYFVKWIDPILPTFIISCLISLSNKIPNGINQFICSHHGMHQLYNLVVGLVKLKLFLLVHGRTSLTIELSTTFPQ